MKVRMKVLICSRERLLLCASQKAAVLWMSVMTERAVSAGILVVDLALRHRLLQHGPEVVRVLLDGPCRQWTYDGLDVAGLQEVQEAGLGLGDEVEIDVKGAGQSFDGRPWWQAGPPAPGLEALGDSDHEADEQVVLAFEVEVEVSYRQFGTAREILHAQRGPAVLLDDLRGRLQQAAAYLRVGYAEPSALWPLDADRLISMATSLNDG